jgi:hypothetical protein
LFQALDIFERYLAYINPKTTSESVSSESVSSESVSSESVSSESVSSESVPLENVPLESVSSESTSSVEVTSSEVVLDCQSGKPGDSNQPEIKSEDHEPKMENVKLRHPGSPRPSESSDDDIYQLKDGELSLKLKFFICLYLSVKYFTTTTVGISFCEMLGEIPDPQSGSENGISDKVMEKCGEFEIFLTFDIMNADIYRDTVYEVADRFGKRLSSRDVERLLEFMKGYTESSICSVAFKKFLKCPRY